jgi:hypothetical protein
LAPASQIVVFFGYLAFQVSSNPERQKHAEIEKKDDVRSETHIDGGEG